MSKDQLKNIIKQAPAQQQPDKPTSRNGGFVNEKPDEKAAKQFTAMAEPEAEGAIRSTEDSYRRKTFNLHQALLDEEQDWVHRKADKIIKPSEIFKSSKSGLFRIKKKANNKRRRL